MRFTITNIFAALLICVLHTCIQPGYASEALTTDDFNYLYSDSDNYTMEDVDRLITDKMTTYNKLVRPKRNITQALKVKVKLSLVALREFDEVGHKFSIVGVLELHWVDDRMAWNTSEYGGVKTIIADNDKFWTPLLVLVNAYEHMEKIGDDSFWPIRFTHTGNAIYFTGDVLTVTCSGDVTYYPWDRQICKLSLVVYSYSSREIQLEALADKISMQRYEGHGQWDIIDTEVEMEHDNTELTYKVIFKRRPIFIVLIMIMPIIFMAALNTLVFLIPDESGERISYSMTALLAIAVFLTIVGDELPKSGKTVSMLCYYLISILGSSISIMLGTIISMRILHSSDDVEIPHWCASFVKCFRCRKKSKQEPNHTIYDLNYAVPDGEPSNGEVNTHNIIMYTGTPYFGDYIQQKAHTVSAGKQTSGVKALKHTQSNMIDSPTETIKWKDVSSVFNMTCFIVSWLALSVFTTVFFASAIHV